MTRIYPILLASLALGACSQSSEFSGDGKRTAAEQAKCDADADTVAELLTTEVKNGDPDNQIEYRISVTNCDGEKVALKAKNIKFDIDGISSFGKSDSKPFIAQAGDTSVEGVLKRVSGSDLFGNTGEKFFYNETDKTLTLPEGTTELTFTVKLKGVSYKPRGAENGNVDADLPTYLAFGDAKVVRKDVHFSGDYTPVKE